MRVKDVRLAQREVERQRLAAGMDVHLVPARDRLRATLVVLQGALGMRAVVHGEHGDHERGPPGLRGDRFHELRRGARARRHDEDAFARFPQRTGEGFQFRIRSDGRGHRRAAPATVVGRERRGEACGTRVHRLAHDRFHFLQLFGPRLGAGGGLLAHDRGADSGMAGQHAHIRARPDPLERVQVLAKVSNSQRVPSSSALRSIPSTTERFFIIVSRSRAGTGRYRSRSCRGWPWSRRAIPTAKASGPR